MRLLCLLASMLLVAGSATAASITITPLTDNTSCGGRSASCTGNAGITGTDWGSTWNTSGGSGSIPSLSLGFATALLSINASTDVAYVPEPGTVGLVLIGMAGMGPIAAGSASAASPDPSEFFPRGPHRGLPAPLAPGGPFALGAALRR